MRNTMSTAAKIEVGALVVATAGIPIQLIGGVDTFPTIPPGIIILLAGALAVVFVPWRWAPILGILPAVSVAIGTPVNDVGRDILLGGWGTVAQIGALTLGLGGVVATIAGVAALARKPVSPAR